MSKTERCSPFNEEAIEAGSGNVFADLGLSDPEERLAKAELSYRIATLIKERKLTQVKAGEILKIDQAKVSKLVRGKLSDFSIATLLEYLTRLGQNVEIVVRPHNDANAVGALNVTILEEPLFLID